MSDSDRELEAEIQIEEEFSDSFNDKEGSDQESDGEGDIIIEICEGSTSYKKAKIDENGKSKRRNRTDSDNASDTMDSEPSHSSQGEKDRQALTDLVKQIRKKKKNKIKEDKEKNSKDNSGSKEKKKKSKNKGEKEKNKNKKKLNDIADKTAIEQDKKKQKEREKEKALEEYQKKFKEFERKYPKYIYKDKIKFPIDDKLFILYPTLLDKYVPKTKKPAPKNTLIPANELGDILQIWDLFHSYKELFSLKNLKQEEIYACLKYQGHEHLYLVDYLHQEILIFIITDFFESYRFEQIKNALDNPFFVLIKYYVGYENSQSKELMLIWPEFLKRLVEIEPYSDYLGPTAKKYIESIAKLTTLNYHKADYKVKLRVLLEVMNLAYETDTLRYYVNVRLDRLNALFYDRANLLSEIKSEQQECTELKAKIEAVEKKQKDLEAKAEQEILQAEDIQNQIAIEAEIKGLQQIHISITKLQTSIEEKQNRVKDINNSPDFQLKTSARLGLDSNKSEYWIFKGHPERLYVKMTPSLYSEDNWRYYDEKEELDALLGALNVKGVQEKDLSEKLKKAIFKGELALKSRNQENKDSFEAVVKTSEDLNPQQNLNYWLAKVNDYSLLVDQPKEENKLQQNDQDDDEEELSIKIQKRKLYDTKYLTIEGIKEILCKTEEKLTLYLEKWNGRWADQETRDDLKRRVREAQDVNELKHTLRELDQHFEFAQIPARQKGLDDHDEDDHSDDDDENIEEDNSQSEHEDKRIVGEENSPNQSDRRKRKNSKASSKEEEIEFIGKLPHRSRMCVEESNKAENISEEKFRKMQLIIWDRSNERIKLCWDAFLTEVNNVTNLFLATSIFNQFVETYVDKKTAKYFTEYTNIVEYFLAKRARKRSETVNRLRGNRKTQDKPLEKLRQDRELRKRTYNFREQDSGSDTSQSPLQEAESRNTYASRRYKQNGDVARDGGRKTRKTRAVDNEKSRKESDEEVELHNLRRSTRNVRKIRMVEESEDEEEDKEEEYKEDEETEKDCCICQQSGELIGCTICLNSFHSACVGLKSLPTDKWTCFTCLQKLASQRHTRSTTRKLH